MSLWLLRRVGQAVLVMLLMTVIVFVGLNAIGNPVDILIGEDLNQLGKARALGNGDDLAARHRDIVDGLLAEVEQVAHHLAFDEREVADDAAAAALVALFLGLVDDVFDLFAQRRFLVAAEQQCLQSGQQSGPTTVFFRSVR